MGCEAEIMARRQAGDDFLSYYSAFHTRIKVTSGAFFAGVCVHGGVIADMRALTSVRFCFQV